LVIAKEAVVLGGDIDVVICPEVIQKAENGQASITLDGDEDGLAISNERM
jgi:hypothetical protein